MNTIIRSLKYMSTLSVAISLVLLSACKDDDDAKSQAEVVTEKLTAKVWNIQSVTVDGVDVTSSFNGLALTLTASSFTSTNGNVVWPASGTWTFTDDSATVIKRNDQVEINIIELTATSLKVSLTWTKTTLGGGRVESVSGVHVFTFQ